MKPNTFLQKTFNVLLALACTSAFGAHELSIQKNESSPSEVTILSQSSFELESENEDENLWQATIDICKEDPYPAALGFAAIITLGYLAWSYGFTPTTTEAQLAPQAPQPDLKTPIVADKNEPSLVKPGTPPAQAHSFFTLNKADAAAGLALLVAYGTIAASGAKKLFKGSSFAPKVKALFTKLVSKQTSGAECIDPSGVLQRIIDFQIHFSPSFSANSASKVRPNESPTPRPQTKPFRNNFNPSLGKISLKQHPTPSDIAAGESNAYKHIELNYTPTKEQLAEWTRHGYKIISGDNEKLIKLSHYSTLT